MKRSIDMLGVDPSILQKVMKGASYLITKRIPEEIRDVDALQYQTSFDSRIRCCHCSIGVVALGLIPTNDVRQCLELGVVTALDYFRGDWAANAEDDENRMSVLKDPANTKLLWWDCFPQGLLMALLLGDQQAVATLSDWVECWMERGFDPSNPDDPIMVKIYISVASAFRTVPLEGLAEMEAKLTKTRAKHPKLLFQAWSAARSGDSAAFARHFRESLQQFEKLTKPPETSADLLAPNESLVLAAARTLGIAMPDLEPRLLARLITHESLGLDKPAGGSKK